MRRLGHDYSLFTTFLPPTRTIFPLQGGYYIIFKLIYFPYLFVISLLVFDLLPVHSYLSITMNSKDLYYFKCNNIVIVMSID